MSRNRSWVFTWNNYTEEEEEYVQEIDCKYLVYGREVGEKGTRHLQGFITFTEGKTFKTVRKIFKENHVEVAKDTKASIAYCKKDGDFYETGERKQGARTDIQEIKEMCKEGSTRKELFEVATSYQAYRFGEIGLSLYEKKRNWKPEVRWYWGPTGTGKSRCAYEEFPEAWFSAEDLKWWDGYDGHEVVVIDDFRGDHCKFSTLLKILDRYPYKVAVKGGN